MTTLMRVLTIGWLTASLAAVAGSAEAGFERGMDAYTRGDMATALGELLPAARADDARAQYLLARIYEQSGAATKQRADAVMWYRRAAVNGIVAAMRRLGDIFRGGQGAESDPVQAYAWYDLASSRLGPYRGSFGLIRDDIAAKLPSPELAHARNLARHWRSDITKIGVMIPPPAPPKRSPPAEVFKSKSSLIKPSMAAAQIRARVRRVQTALATRGYDVGPVDGIVGPRTGAAIRAFQSDQGLAPDGRVTSGLIEKLDGDAEES